MYGEDFKSCKQVNERFKNGLKMGVKALSEQESLRPVKYKTDKNIKLVAYVLLRMKAVEQPFGSKQMIKTLELDKFNGSSRTPTHKALSVLRFLVKNTNIFQNKLT